jgi:hypothetical protein
VDLAALAAGRHSPDLELLARYKDWADDGRLAAGLAGAP